MTSARSYTQHASSVANWHASDSICPVAFTNKLLQLIPFFFFFLLSSWIVQLPPPPRTRPQVRQSPVAVGD